MANRASKFVFRLCIGVIVAGIFPLVVSSQSFPQNSKIPVSVGQTGDDKGGQLFAEAVKKQISQSNRYEPMPEKGVQDGLRYYIEMISVDSAAPGPQQGKRSVVSIVIEEFGRPNSFPVAYMWYHKVIVVNCQSVDKLAKSLLEDMEARRCRLMKSSLGGCPQEKFDPKLGDED